MKVVTLDVQPRQLGSKGNILLLRKSGKIPAVFYGKDIESKSISVDSKAFTSIIEENGANVIIDLNFEGKKNSTIVKFLQRDIITQAPIHIDFQYISLASEVEVLVPIHIDGVADGVKNFGGVMEFIVREVKIKALPKSIPQKVSVDVSALGIGHGVTIADLPKLDGVSYIQDPTTLVINVVAMSLEEEKPAVEGAEVAQPEVISKGKKDKEGEDAATAASGTGTKK
jgi:large subunit ribosomal protein L25